LRPSALHGELEALARTVGALNFAAAAS
jgi:hypothetical protein